MEEKRVGVFQKRTYSNRGIVLERSNSSNKLRKLDAQVRIRVDERYRVSLAQCL
jgi:hypothetical protein